MLQGMLHWGDSMAALIGCFKDMLQELL